MPTSPALIVAKTILSEAVHIAIEKGIDSVDKRLDSLVRRMKKEKEIKDVQFRTGEQKL